VVDSTFILQATLKANGFSLTSPRKAVFAALQNQEPQTMNRLVLACQDEIDRASVYRTIALFERLGIVQRLNIGWKYKLELSDTFSHHHHHLTCIKCGKVIPIAEDKVLEQQLNELSALHDFLPQDHQLEIRGLCQACNLKRPELLPRS
jgi:Fur family ferric uptake transcriptional regulator